MDHYVDIKILPDPEFPAPMLMNALFSKLHRALAEKQADNIGVSFPKVDEKKPSTGDVLRLHSSHSALQQLFGENWLKGMRDHLEVGKILPIPSDALHRQVTRVQVKSNSARMRRRYQKRHPDAVEEEIEKLIPDHKEQRSTLPYLQLKSQSSGQQFRFFIKHHEPQAQPVSGSFNCYGLSNSATVPWF